MTTYVLGAGASHHAGYPLCSELWPHMTDWVSKTPSRNPRFQEAIDTVVRLNGPVTDVEAAFTNLCLGHGAFAALAPTKLRTLARNIRCCLQASFEKICKRGPPAGRYAALAKQLTSGDAVVTFNYDVALEIELIRARKFRVRDGYGFEADWDEPTSDVKLLKLHGSINWTGEIAGPRPGSISVGVIRPLGPYVDNGQSLLPDYPGVVLDSACSGRGGMTDPSITMILPTHLKRFGVETSFGDVWGDLYQKLWNKANELLARSDRIVIIGYSMPQADKSAGQLLLGGSNKDAPLTICCGGATWDVEQRFRRAGFANIHRVDDPTFDGYLAHHAA